LKRLAFFLCGLFVASSLATANAASPPTIEKVWSFNVASTSAGLSVTFYSHGLRPTVVFKLSNHSNMADARVVAENRPLPALGGLGSHALLGDLRPDTSYWYQAFVTTGEGHASSLIGHFRTAR
jgi:phosphodiesterase/alkaline phosphatase D-like protein